MRPHHATAGSAHLPKGLSFRIDDLRRFQTWAKNHNVRMAIGLDHGVDDEEYEEVITLHTGTGSSCFLLLWCNEQAVFAQPLVGRQLKYRSVSHLLESLAASHEIVETDNTMHNRN
jgi:hypothetical protein